MINEIYIEDACTNPSLDESAQRLIEKVVCTTLQYEKIE